MWLCRAPHSSQIWDNFRSLPFFVKFLLHAFTVKFIYTRSQYWVYIITANIRHFTFLCEGGKAAQDRDFSALGSVLLSFSGFNLFERQGASSSYSKNTPGNPICCEKLDVLREVTDRFR
ncbi:hypothetical protein DPMN_096746 [Dreissena polymorpha]|uniref:Uncharacterized protein n=1 Tax=Dreissena polymorpha TaxID=45954 RepID=A0A9D4R516_DREPO|nr:hypothetical protein DPMN_096746 [Dreissena polymorpha]